MTDHRSRREKLRAMANQSVSPHEAEIARRKLAEMGDRPEPTQPPRFSFSTAFYGMDFFSEWQRAMHDIDRYEQATATYEQAREYVRNGEWKVKRRHVDRVTGKVSWEWEEP